MTLELRSEAEPIRWAQVLVGAAQLAERIAGTEFVPSAMRGKPDVVTAAIMYGDEIGVGPMQALAGIHVVEGKPQPSAELMRALILREGHTLTVHESTGDRCRMSGIRAGRPDTERAVVEWTRDMARAAGLLGRQNWQKYPRAMLLARATGDLARMLFPDVVKGLSYVSEDSAVDSWGPDTVDAEPEPSQPRRKAVQRRTRPAARPIEDAPPPPAEPPPHHGGGGARPPIAPDHLTTRVDKEDRPLPDMPEPGGKPPPRAMPELPEHVSGGELPPDRFGVEPEPGPPEPEAGERGIAPPILRAIHARLGKVIGRGLDEHEARGAKLALVSAVLGSSVESTRDLTRSQGYRVLDFLTACEVGEATWEADPETGVVHITDLREPPPEAER